MLEGKYYIRIFHPEGEKSESASTGKIEGYVGDGYWLINEDGQEGDFIIKHIKDMSEWGFYDTLEPAEKLADFINKRV